MINNVLTFAYTSASFKLFENTMTLVFFAASSLTQQAERRYSPFQHGLNHIFRQGPEHQFYNKNKQYENEFLDSFPNKLIHDIEQGRGVLTQSPEEIQKLIIPSQFSQEEVYLHIMSKGLTTQMPYLYLNFHHSFHNVLVFVCEKACQEQGQNQIIIANSFKKIIEEHFQQVTNKELSLIFDTCLECLNNLQSISNEEMISVMELIIKKYINYKELFKRMEDKALELGKATQPILSRITSCRIISVLSKYMNRALKSEMVDIVKRLSSENEIQAKKVWLMEFFPKLLHNLDLDFIELHFQEKIYETVWDENQEICRLALEAILKNVTKFSLQQQSSRIVKLFIDSLTSRNEKTAIMASQLVGQVYQKLQNVILKNEANCIRFWKSLIELSQSKNQKIVNNLIYNLYGILKISAPYHKVDPLCDIYISMFYSSISNKLLLASYYHEMAILFKSKSGELKQVFMWMFNEVLAEDELADEAFQIINKIIHHLPQSAQIFLTPHEQENIGQDGSEPPRYFQEKFCDNLIKYLNLLWSKKIVSWITPFYTMLYQCSEYFSHTFIQQSLLPKLYLILRSKTVQPEYVTEIMVKLISRDCNPVLINTYMSKISNELYKSTKSYQRQIAILFYYYSSFYFSIEMFHQYKLGEKYLSLNNDKVFKVRASFITHLNRIHYFLTRQERLQYSIIISRLAKDTDPEIVRIINGTDFIQSQAQAKKIVSLSASMRQRQKEKMMLGSMKRQQTYIGRSNKELRKEEVLKKRIETTKTKNKTLTKELPKKKLIPLLVKTTSNFHFQKRS